MVQAMDDQQQQPVQRLKRRHTPAPLVQRIVGWISILLGLLGMVLPILPGVILLTVGILLLGPHDPALRRMALSVRLALRRWSQVKQPYLRWIGWNVRRTYGTVRLQLRAQRHRLQHRKSLWRDSLLVLAAAGVMLVMVAGISLMIWNQTP